MFDKGMYLNNPSFKKQRECKVCCTCHNICVYGESPKQSLNHHEISHFLDPNDPCNEIQEIKKGSIRLFNCSSVAYTPGGTNPSCQIEVKCLECNEIFHVCFANNGISGPNKFYCQKQKIIKDRPRKRSYSDGSIGIINTKTLPSSMKLLFERQATDFDTFGFSLENESDEDNENCSSSPNFQISNDEDDQDYDIMFSSTSKYVTGGFSDLGKFMFDTNQLGCYVNV